MVVRAYSSTIVAEQLLSIIFLSLFFSSFCFARARRLRRYDDWISSFTDWAVRENMEMASSISTTSP